MSNNHKNMLWQFIDNKGSFRVDSPDSTSRLYFPLSNEAGLLSSITPDLHGDIKTNHNSFLTLPVTIEDLHDSKASRNFWVHVEGKGAWSATGVSALAQAKKFLHKNEEKTSLEAGMLWHKIRRENTELGLESEILNFVPAGEDTVEIMVVTIKNNGKSTIKITPTSAIPIFGRSADNLRDHYHVTSLLHRIISHAAGVVVKPTMSFDERGHKINETLYAVVGADAAGEFPVGAFYTVPEFIGEGGHLEAPQAILKNSPLPSKDGRFYQGKSAIGALRFKTQTLAPKQKCEFVLLLGIAKKDAEIDQWLKCYGSGKKAHEAFEQTKKFWDSKSGSVRFSTPDTVYNGWTRWISIQPFLRKIFGCSFLPDFDYGRGGRGWRDLWQDCLALLLTSPGETRQMLLHNFNGVRIDGSNATIIGSSNEFIADRNNITRVWMDHGVWPYITLELYIHQSGDLGVLFEQAGYFRDRQLWRARKKDNAWTEAEGKVLKTKRGQTVQGTVLEHILVQHLVQFHNVGEHNHIRLENADWNDGLDMAYDRGESVAFTALYGSNLLRIASLLEECANKLSLKKIAVAKELLILLDRAAGKKKTDYNSAEKKRKVLENYFEAVQPAISGVKTEIRVAKLVEDLRAKGEHILSHVRQKEWIQTHSGDAFFNGYYDNHGRRVEGDSPRGLHMTLAGQVFTIMSSAAEPKQVREAFASAKKYLKDKEHGGFRLNTDFHEIRPDLGRAFSFAYGEKENGAFFSHMAVMFANALYQRGFVYEGREVLDSIYQMCLRTEKSKIYPGIPEYFNSEGRGLYHYLTGSASWLLLTLLTQVFGVRGRLGDLWIEPKLTKDDFRDGNEVSVETEFAGKRIEVIYKNPKKISYEHYHICKVTLNGKDVKQAPLNQKHTLIPRDFLISNGKKTSNQIVVTLE